MNYKEIINFTVIAILAVWIYGINDVEGVISMHDYLVCKNHYAASRIREKRVEDRRLTCAFYCGRHYWCRAVTIHKYGNSVECHYHDGIFDVDCNSFPVLINRRLLLKKEVYVMPEEHGCFNGGIYSSGICNCDSGFTGTNCERYIKDCKEGKDIGLINIGGLTSAMIKPTGSSLAFEALCHFSLGHTLVLLRNSLVYDTPFNRSWNEYKYSFGINGNFWIGLENMYRVIRQPEATFKLQVYCANTALSEDFSVYYTTFSIGSEATSYAMVVGMIAADPENDGLGQNSGPIPFCTYDKPCSGLPNTNGGGWWYNFLPNKLPYALTVPTGIIKWQYRNNLFSTDLLSVTLERLGG